VITITNLRISKYSACRCCPFRRGEPALGRTKSLADFNIPVSDHALHQRVVYAESAARGLGVIEAEPLARPAGARLAQSLLARMERAAA
jgi:hypothetical protein